MLEIRDAVVTLKGVEVEQDYLAALVRQVGG